MSVPFSLSRRSFSQLCLGAAAATVLGAAGAEPQGRPVVVELFTSQGCSASPPADALLAELSQRQGVVALSLNVDYWDYLGWRDTLGSPDCAQRQRDYAARRGDGQVYTPQMVINGGNQMLGSDRDAVFAAVARESARDPSSIIPVSLTSGDREVWIDVAAAPGDEVRQEATVWVVALVPNVVVEIGSGENAGRTMAYTNVVRKIIPAGLWHGREMRLVLPRPAIMSESTMCAALLQADGTGPILGASILPSRAV
jgi:hypothetical protein